METKKKQTRDKKPGCGVYGEPTTLRRIPNSLLSVIDEILALKKAAVYQSPERIVKRLLKDQIEHKKRAGGA